MTPQEFLEAVVWPNVAAMHADYDQIRHAYNAVHAVDSTAAFFFWWIKANQKAIAEKDDTEYRENLARQNESFAILRDIAKALKHVELNRGRPIVARADQVTVKSLGWGEGRYGEARWGSPPQVIVDLGASQMRVIDPIIEQALHFIETKMMEVGILKVRYHDWRREKGLPSLISTEADQP